MDNSDAKWLRKATTKERLFEAGHKLQVYLTHYTLHLDSVKPIEEEMLRKGLVHLYRKVPVLRICLGERNSELWLREMEACNIDLKVIKEGDLEEEKDKVTLHTYNSEEGPLWCVRFLPLGGTSPPSSSEQVKKDFAYNYALILGIHHGLADGTTNVKICNLLCNIMDDLMAGRVVNDEEQLGELTGEEELLAIYDQEMKKLKANPELCREIKRELEEGAKIRPLTRHVCEIPPNTTIMTRNVVATFDQPISERFYKKAKSKGVTLHSALTGLTNLAMTKLLQELGVIQDEYNIRAGHDINVRRYYTGDSSRVLGVHGPLFGYRGSFLVPKDMLPVFWDTVKVFHENFQSVISSRKVLTTAAYRMMAEDTKQHIVEFFRSDGEPNYYYTISNMGNLKGMLSEGGDSVSVRKLTRFSSLRNGKSFICLLIHTFRGQLNISFAYSTQFLTHEFVHRLKELIQIHMTSVCEL